MSRKNTVDWSGIRDGFPVTANATYLNAAGMSPLSNAVYESGVNILNLMRTDPKRFAEETLMLLTNTRESVSRLYDVDPSGVSFTHTTSLAMNLLAIHFKNCMPGKREIVTLHDEFPSSTLPWAYQGFDMRYVSPEKDNSYNIEKIVDATTSETAAVVASYVQYNTGAKVDISDLAHRLRQKGIHFIANVTQATGVLPVRHSDIPASAIVSSGNKWLMSGVGAASMYLSEDLRGHTFPPVAGWISAVPIGFNNRLGEISKAAYSLECGLNSLVPIACLGCAIDFILDLGIENIQLKIESLTTRLMERLNTCGEKILTPPNMRAGIVSLYKKNAESVVERLKEKGVVVSSRGENLLRVSPHIYNNEADIDIFIEHL